MKNIMHIPLTRYAIDIGGSVLGYKSGEPITFLIASKAERLAKYLNLYAKEIGFSDAERNIKVIEYVGPFRLHRFKISPLIESLQF